MSLLAYIRKKILCNHFYSYIWKKSVYNVYLHTELNLYVILTLHTDLDLYVIIGM